jgi:hypothetical protein
MATTADHDHRGEPQLPFGDWLVRRGLIDRGQLFFALTLSFQRGIRVGDALVNLRVLSRRQVEEEAEKHQVFRSFFDMP